MTINMDGYTKINNGGGFHSTYSASKSVAWTRNKASYTLVFSRFVPQEIRNADGLEVFYNKQRNSFLVAPSANGDFHLTKTNHSTMHLNSKSLCTYMAKVFGIHGNKSGTTHLATGITGSNGKNYLLIKGVYDVKDDPFVK